MCCFEVAEVQKLMMDQKLRYSELLTHPPPLDYKDYWPSNFNQSHLPNECEWLYPACIYSTEILLYTNLLKWYVWFNQTSFDSQNKNEWDWLNVIIWTILYIFTINFFCDSKFYTRWNTILLKNYCFLSILFTLLFYQLEPLKNWASHILPSSLSRDS